jgi:hypothetical protein
MCDESEVKIKYMTILSGGLKCTGLSIACPPSPNDIVIKDLECPGNFSCFECGIEHINVHHNPNSVRIDSEPLI